LTSLILLLKALEDLGVVSSLMSPNMRLASALTKSSAAVVRFHPRMPIFSRILTSLTPSEKVMMTLESEILGILLRTWLNRCRNLKRVSSGCYRIWRRL